MIKYHIAVSYTHLVYQLGVSMDQLMDSLEELVYDKSVIVTEERDVYLPSLYYSEMNCARMLFDLNVPVERCV